MSTISLVQAIPLYSQDGIMNSVWFKDDGTEFYVIGNQYKKIYKYTCPTAWSLTSASYSSTSFTITPTQSNTFGLSFSGSGKYMYITNSSTKNILEYELGTNWDITTASYVNSTTLSATYHLTVQSIFVNEIGTALFIGDANDKIIKYIFE